MLRMDSVTGSNDLSRDGNMRVRNPEIKKLQEQLRRLDRSEFTIKSAALGGGQDMPFEQAFGNLAHAYLKDKAPGLQDYEVGFQLVDRNQENTKAVGVFGFKVGSQWLYAPVFFLNGDLKGHELLYIKNQDMFVPLKENWLNYLLNRRPNILGEGVDKNLSRLGVMAPSMSQLTRSPAKFASDNQQLKKYAEWVRPVLSDFAYFATTSPLHDSKYSGTRNLLDFIKDAGAKGVHVLVRAVSDYPALRPALNEIYGEQEIDRAVKEAAANERFKRSVLAPRRAPSPTSLIKSAATKNSAVKSVKVTTLKKVMSEGGTRGATLDDDEKEQLLRSEITVKDTRDDSQVTIAFSVDIAHRLQNPSESGLYEVLSKPGEFCKCLVIIGPYNCDGQRNFATLVDVDKGTWINTTPATIWTHTHYERAAYDKWFENLKEDQLRKSEKSLYVVIGPTGQGSLPFQVSGKADSEGLEIFDVKFESTAVRDRPVSLPPHKWPEAEPLTTITGPTRLVRTGYKGKSLKAVGRELLVPDGFKVMKLEPKPEKKEDEGEEGEDSKDPQQALEQRDRKTKSDKDKKTDPSGDDNAHSEESPIFDLGTLADFESGILKAGGLRNLEIRHTGTHVTINNGPEMTSLDALVDLIENKGLREKQARDVLDISKGKKVGRFLLKMGESPYELQRSSPSAPPFPDPAKTMDPMVGGQVETQPGMETEMPIPGMGAAAYDRSVYDVRPDAYSQPNMVGGSSGPDKKDMETALNAAHSGQREVFDTAILGSLLKAVHDDTMVDKYMGDLMKGMDRLARILFLFYWHQDEFEDRYGKQDLPELEDGLRNAFEAMGDIVLFLKQKTIDPHPDEQHDVDLKSIAS